MNRGAYGYPAGPPVSKVAVIGFPCTAYFFAPASESPTMSANRAIYQSNIGPSMVITRIAIHVTTQSGNIDLGVYSRSGSVGESKPGTRKFTTGSMACPAVGYREIAIPATLIETGDYFAFVGDNGTYRVASGKGGTPFVSDIFKGVMYQQASVFPLPVTAGSLTATANDNDSTLMKGLP